MRTFALYLLPILLFSAEGRRPVIAIGGIYHESDSFNPTKTKLEDFGPRDQMASEEYIRRETKSNTNLGGFIVGAREVGLDLYPTFWVTASPSGPLTSAAFQTLSADFIRRIKAAPKLDGIFLSLMGAMIAEDFPNADTEIVRRVREAVGRDLPIIVVHDYHANVSAEIVALTDVLITGKECPHLDTKERGIQAARIMASIVSGKVKPVQALAKPPMIYNLIFQNTYIPPLLAITEESRRLEKNAKILAASVPGGYQWGDVPHMGPSVIVVTDGDRGLAETEAKGLLNNNLYKA